MSQCHSHSHTDAIINLSWRWGHSGHCESVASDAELGVVLLHVTWVNWWVERASVEVCACWCWAVYLMQLGVFAVPWPWRRGRHCWHWPPPPTACLPLDVKLLKGHWQLLDRNALTHHTSQTSFVSFLSQSVPSSVLSYVCLCRHFLVAVDVSTSCTVHLWLPAGPADHKQDYRV